MSVNVTPDHPNFAEVCKDFGLEPANTSNVLVESGEWLRKLGGTKYTWGNSVGHALTIVRGYTNIDFSAADTILHIGGPAGPEHRVMARWISREVPLVSDSMRLVADTVRVEISGVVLATLDAEEDTVFSKEYYFDHLSEMADRTYQLQVTLVHTRKNGTSFNSTRIMSFVGKHFFRFED